MTERKQSNIEYLRNYPLSRLVILVHPYFEGHDEAYARRSDEIYKTAERIYSPLNPEDFMLLIPNKKLKENSNQMDLIRRIRSRSMFPDNVQVAPDIVGADRNYHVIDDELSKYGKKVDQDTEVIIGGERLDQCVESAAKRMLKNPNIRQLKISRMVSLHSKLDNPAEASSWQPCIIGAQVTRETGYFVIKKN